jgi:ubiquinone/menaquinone biosynthesis C-methylase UbiE
MIVSSNKKEDRLDGFLDILRCPRSGQPLFVDGDALTTADRRQRYAYRPRGIVMFANDCVSPEARTQRHHYNNIAKTYTANIEYPHTREYLAYLDGTMLAAVGSSKLGVVAELCCGRGEALTLFGDRIGKYVGIDVSEKMLEAGLKELKHPNAILLQAEATRVPLSSESVDTVVMLGGIHHVPQRSQLFAEIARILKPGGRLLYREPVSDLALWRALRAIVYRLSPMLNYGTERPLRYEETVPVMEAAGLKPVHYRTHGLIGFCLFMNSDVLYFNRIFRFIPGISSIARASARLDEAILGLPGLRRAGMQVIGIAEKPIAGTYR